MARPGRWTLPFLQEKPYRVITPVLAGSIMLGASLSPWLADPLGRYASAWQLPVNLGWQVQSSVCSYGLLCLGCALSAYFVAVLAVYAKTRSVHLIRVWPRPALTAGLLCLVPSVLLAMQYLFMDIGGIAQLTQHEMQAVLIKSHFDYGSAAQFSPIRSMLFDPSTFHARVALLLDQIGPGFFLPLVSTLLLLAIREHHPGTIYRASEKRRRWRAPLMGGLLLLCVIVLGRGPMALACNEQAEHLLITGNYADALVWLDNALVLNPALDQLPSYHIERGQAWYYLHPNQPTIDTQAYLGAFSLQQNDLLSSYQELLAAHQQAPQARWLIDEFGTTLERLAEMDHPLNGEPTLRLPPEEPALPWLYEIVQMDPTNVYAHYMIGRLNYDLHDYTTSEAQMTDVLNLTQENTIKSSAYTYIALCRGGEGDEAAAREYLFKAEDIDPELRNNTTREEISGLR